MSLTDLFSSWQMQESFSRSSVSCLINADLHARFDDLSSEDKKSDPCWQVTQQLHYHIEKVLIYFCLIQLQTFLITLFHVQKIIYHVFLLRTSQAAMFLQSVHHIQ